MRALLVTHAFPRRAGDMAGSFILRLAVGLRDTGVDVRVLAPAGPGLAAHDTLEGIAVERFRYAPARWETLAYEGTMAEQVRGSWSARLALGGMVLAGARAVSRAVARHRPDVVHAHWWFPAGVSCALARGARPLVLTLHGSDVRLAPGSGAAPLAMRAVTRRAAAVTAVSQWLADRATLLAPDCRAAVLPMPVDVSRFPEATELAEPRVLFVGRLNAQKGVRDVIAAMPHVDERAVLDVVGDGPDRAAAEALALSIGVAPRVTWHGQLAQANLAPRYRAAAAVAIPSTEEGLGLVAVEAALSGAPVVAYRSGGLAELVDPGTTGLLVEPGNVAELARALDSLVRDPARARTMGHAGRARMLERFSPAVAARAYAALYASVAR